MLLQYRLCELSTIGPRWYISYYAWNLAKNKLQRVRVFYNRGSKANRLRMMRKECELLNYKLEHGWSPFSSDIQKNQFTRICTALDFVLSYKLAYIREASKGNYRNRIDLLKKWIHEKGYQDLFVFDFTEFHAQEFMNDLLMRKKIIGRTHNNYLIDFRTFFNLLKKRKYISENPFHSIEELPETEKQKIPFSVEQRIAYARYCRKQEYNFYMVSMLCYYLGMRPTEITQVKVGDVNPHKKLIIIRPEVSKNKKVRILRIADVFWNEFYQWIKSYPGHYYICAKGFSPGQEKIRANEPAKKFRPIANQLKFPKEVKFYSLKDTCADALSECGIALKTIRDLFGHSSVAITDNYMRHFDAGAFDQLAEVFPLFDTDHSKDKRGSLQLSGRLTLPEPVTAAI